MTTAEQIIETFKMKPLPVEGGFYAETYRSQEKIALPLPPAGQSGQRSLATAILYLLTPDTYSALHRVKSDEIFHFYLGDPVTMLQLRPDGTARTITIGSDVLSGQLPQVTVPKNTWQGCVLNEGGRFALMGTTVAPGFEFDDFELPDIEQLLRQYPDRRELIMRLARDD
ncbi:MAG: cupin domain-containing protein [Phycisphaerales bacterium]|nr:MAG: cupin domain-containing protein [Phycisphaerales bacterium]